MVLGYGYHKAEVISYLMDSGEEYKFIDPGEDKFKDMCEIAYLCKEAKGGLVIYSPDDIADGEIDFFYWVNTFYLKKRPLVVLNDTSNQQYRKLFEMVYKFKDKVSPMRAAYQSHYVQVETGQIHAGQCPFGYDYMNGHYVVNDWEKLAVRECFKRRSDGESWQSIADALNRKGYRSKRGNKLNVGIHMWVENRKFYEGYEKLADGTYKKLHEPIIRECDYEITKTKRGRKKNTEE